LSWAGLRGAVPVVLATVPLTARIKELDWLFHLVFVLVVVFTLVQAPVLPFLARRLRVGNVVDSRDLDLESAPLVTLNADAVQVRIGETSRMHGLEIFELRLPEGANVTLVVRDGAAFVPEPRTVLRRGDQLLVVTTSTARRDVLQRLRAVSQGGRLAVWEASAADADRRAERGRTEGRGAGRRAGRGPGGGGAGSAGEGRGASGGAGVGPGAGRVEGRVEGRLAGLVEGRLTGLVQGRLGGRVQSPPTGPVQRPPTGPAQGRPDGLAGARVDGRFGQLVRRVRGRAAR
jgi:cell volume regulation protein A